MFPRQLLVHSKASRKFRKSCLLRMGECAASTISTRRRIVALKSRAGGLRRFRSGKMPFCSKAFLAIHVLVLVLVLVATSGVPAHRQTPGIHADPTVRHRRLPRAPDLRRTPPSIPRTPAPPHSWWSAFKAAVGNDENVEHERRKKNEEELEWSKNFR